MFFRTYIFAEKHIFFVRPLLEHGVYLTGDTRKIFVSKTVDESHSARVLIGCKPIRRVREGALQKTYVFHVHPQRAPNSMFSCRSHVADVFLKMEQDRPTREHGFGCPLGMHMKNICFLQGTFSYTPCSRRGLTKNICFSANIYVPKNICFLKKYICFLKKYICFLKKYICFLKKHIFSS